MCSVLDRPVNGYCPLPAGAKELTITNELSNEFQAETVIFILLPPKKLYALAAVVEYYL